MLRCPHCAKSLPAIRQQIREPGGEPGLIALAGMENELSALLGGRRVDLRTAEDLSRYFRDEVVSTAEAVRDAGGCDSWTMT
jgi:hypothetical protein